MRRSIFVFVLTTIAVLTGGAWSTPAEAQLQRSGAWAFGPAYAVDDDPVRSLAFLGAGGVVRIVDLATLGSPQVLADIHTHGLVEDIFYDAATQRLFLACGEGGLEIWDVAAPAAPALLGRSEILYFGVETPVGHVGVLGDIAIVECSWGYVHTVDVSDPTAPVQVAFNGVMGNPAHNLSIGTGGQVHATGAQYYVRLGISPSGSIDVTGQRHFDFGAGAVFGTPEVAYVGYGSSMYILDLLVGGALPWAVVNVGGITEIEVHDGVAYLVNDDGFRTWDVSVHTSPSYLAGIDRVRLLDDIVVDAPYAYVAASQAGLEVYDVADPAAPTVAATFAGAYGGASDVDLRDGYAFIAGLSDGLLIVDLDNLESVELARVDTPGSSYDVDLDGDLAYVADVDGGLRVVDVSDPTAPVEVGVLDSFDAWRVAAAGGVAYVIESIPNQPYALHTVDVSNPAVPADLGSLPLPELSWGLVLAGDRLYVAGYGGGVVVYDVSVPTAPVQMTSIPIPDVTEVEIVGDLMYAASFQIGGVDGGLYVVDVGDPMMPTQLAHLTDPGFLPFHVAVDGDYAYAGSGDDLRLYDVSDPTSPQTLETYRMPWDVFRITARQGRVYSATGHAGMQVLDNTVWVAPGLIFADGFESGDTSAWSAVP